MSAPVDQPDFAFPTLMAAAEYLSGVVLVPSAAYTDVLTFLGTGELIQASLDFLTVVAPTPVIYYAVIFYADGNYVVQVDNRQVTQATALGSGRCSMGEFYTDPTHTFLHVRLPIKFRTDLRVRAWQNTGAGVTTIGRVCVNLVR